MTQIGILTEQWLKRNEQEMIACPHQPGNLLISKKSCSERHKISQSIKGNGFWFDDRAHYNSRISLLKCRECQIGEKLAKTKSSNC